MICKFSKSNKSKLNYNFIKENKTEFYFVSLQKVIINIGKHDSIN